MRLTEDERRAICRAVQQYLPPSFHGELRLYGSRTQDSARGGDIDLALVAMAAEDADALKRIDYKIVAAMKGERDIGEQKIDFKVISVKESGLGFFGEALKESVVLERF